MRRTVLTQILDRVQQRVHLRGHHLPRQQRLTSRQPARHVQLQCLDALHRLAVGKHSCQNVEAALVDLADVGGEAVDKRKRKGDGRAKHPLGRLQLAQELEGRAGSRVLCVNGQHTTASARSAHPERCQTTEHTKQT